MLSSGIPVAEVVETIASEYKKQTAKLNTELHLLSPKRQIRRIFPTLFLALIFLILYHVSKNECWFVKENFFIRNLFFILSFISAAFGVYFLKNVAWTVIDVKQELAQVITRARKRLKGFHQ